ncbi:hypothetical protein HOK68_05365 [Candidatus Woesearchaeota archaeon]|jgi:hypothetical protein|nr:hypothetical protein [Candidatus Woesearchaeota archaeon]MBT4387416.1 hypothetical protein [Candidatus Woesearchaeota archaeon]MBT4595793.1 hypothetical protein [Candidatus Woesearchaeota archaeon]MBT5741358.1 hypothetical protein [Candidatus Woesearchaeota archaeon]MBT6506179.1 hypothetical protein [Candidatus Woesearchaeota archaeon]
MGYTLIAPVGDNLKALFFGLKEFPTERVFLITPKSRNKDAHSLKKKLEYLTIETKIISISENIMEETFKVFAKICSTYDSDNILVNVASGDKYSTCAALSASYANGLKAFGIMNNKVMLMPIMKLSYYNELSENKLKLLKYLENEDYVSLQQLSKLSKLSISLLSYHINGNYKYKGLIDFRLVETKEESKNLYVKLSDMGRLLLKGYINRTCELKK